MTERVDFAIDLETGGTRPGDVVLQAGIVAFEPLTDKILAEMEVNISLDESLKQGFQMTAGTLNFWMTKVTDEARRLVWDEGQKKATNIVSALASLNHFYELNSNIGEDGKHVGKGGGLWCQGQDFDLGLLHAYFNHFDYERAWGYRSGRDVRSVCDLMNFSGRDVPLEGELHTALTDARWTAKVVQRAFQLAQGDIPF